MTRRKVAGSPSSNAAAYNEITRLENICALQQGGIREAFRLLERLKLVQAREELARFLPQEEIDRLRVQRRPCP